MKLKEIFANGWYDRLQPILNSKEFVTIGKELTKRINNNEVLTPELSHIFDPFKWCNYNDLKVVFLFDNLAINTTKERYFWDAIEKEVYDGLNLNLDKNLQRLGNQGVMFLSKDLTENDEELWKPFYNFVVSTIREYNSGVIFVGNFRDSIESGLFENWASNSNFFLPSTEPFSKNSFSESWETGGIFDMINSYLKQTNNTEIEW